MNQAINPTSAEIAAAIAAQPRRIYVDGKVREDVTLSELIGELARNDDANINDSVGEQLRKHALADLALIDPLVSMDGALFGSDVSRLANRARIWLELAPEIERRLEGSVGGSKNVSAKPRVNSDTARNPWNTLADLNSILHELRHNFDTVWCNAREALEGNEELQGTAKILDTAAHKVLADVQAAELYIDEAQDWLRATGVEMECLKKARSQS